MGDQVETWLRSNGVPSQYVKAILNAGYTEMLDMNDAIAKFIVKPMPGLAVKLRRTLQKEREEEEKKLPKNGGEHEEKAPTPKPEATPPDIPTLPTGTELNLSPPEKIEAPDGVTFKLPDDFSVQPDDKPIEDPADLTPEDWKHLATKTGMRRAYHMTDFDADEENPPQSKLEALDWVDRPSRDFMESATGASSVSAKLTYSENTASYVRAGFDTEAFEGCYAFCSASFQRKHEERRAESSYKKSLQMIGKWFYPRATVTLLGKKGCAKLSPGFVEAVRKALASESPRKELQDLFAEWGIAAPNEVLLGGLATFLKTRTMEGEVNEKSVKATIVAAVNIKSGPRSASASTSQGAGSEEKLTAQSLVESSTFKYVGGNTLVSDTKTWPATVGPAKSWDVIGRSKLVPLVDLLDAELHKKVLDVWSEVAVHPAVLDDEPLPASTRSEPVPVSGFLLASISAGGGRGSIELVCDQSSDPRLAGADAVGGRAHVRYADDDHFHYMGLGSIFLPLPSESHYHTDGTRSGNTQFRFDFVETRLSFGAWVRVFSASRSGSSGERVAETDGFLFASLQTNENNRGFVHASIDGERRASASAHLNSDSGAVMGEATFCLPVPRGTRYAVSLEPTQESPSARAWWLPVTSRAWKLGKAVERSLDTEFTAESDGILHGTIAMLHDFETRSDSYMLMSGMGGGLVHSTETHQWYVDGRWTNSYPDGRTVATLVLAAEKQRQDLGSAPISRASASVQYCIIRDVHIQHASATLPVRAGYIYRATKQQLAPAEAKAWWTPIVPAYP
jgi:hypothetical protein